MLYIPRGIQVKDGWHPQSVSLSIFSKEEWDIYARTYLAPPEDARNKHES